MNARILRTVILKDLTLYFRNRFFAPITNCGSGVVYPDLCIDAGISR
jgi:hypothetical protein